MNFEYCPNCGEHVDRGYTEDPGEAPCDNCEMHVEPISDADNAAMPFKPTHPIQCTGCGEAVQLAGLHMGEYSDGVIVACDCSSLSAIPSELGEPELPSQWEIIHDSELYPDEEPDCDSASDPGPNETRQRPRPTSLTLTGSLVEGGACQ